MIDMGEALTTGVPSAGYLKLRIIQMEGPVGAQFELLAGRYRGKFSPAGTVLLSGYEWARWIEPIVKAYADGYGWYENTPVGAAVWRRVIDHLGRVERVVCELESNEELEVEYASPWRLEPPMSEIEFREYRDGLVVWAMELRQWLEATLKTHSTITVLGI